MRLNVLSHFKGNASLSVYDNIFGSNNILYSTCFGRMYLLITPLPLFGKWPKWQQKYFCILWGSSAKSEFLWLCWRFEAPQHFKGQPRACDKLHQHQGPESSWMLSHYMGSYLVHHELQFCYEKLWWEMRLVGCRFVSFWCKVWLFSLELPKSRIGWTIWSFSGLGFMLHSNRK